jgi:transcriptional regulator with XRE-family HTH domain
MTLGAASRAERERLGLSQRGLADRAGVTQPTVSLIENGRVPLPTTLDRLAMAMGTTAEDLAAKVPGANS